MSAPSPREQAAALALFDSLTGVRSARVVQLPLEGVAP